MTKKNRDEFPAKVIEALAKRASYICSNPDCRALTIAPSEIDPEKHIYIGEASHITAAAAGGPRYDVSLSTGDRNSIENGIFLCKGCARMIDVNDGIDFPGTLLKSWKKQHEEWARSNLNKSSNSIISIVGGEHHASGRGEVVGLDVRSPVLIRPGTKVSAEGVGNVTATRIDNRKGENK